jgi:transcriptional regulator with XRE-family HTH domain
MVSIAAGAPLPGGIMLLREARRRAGLSQAELGQAVGVHQNTVSAWERGLLTPSKDALVRLIAILGVDSPADLGYRLATEVVVEAVR